MQIVVDDGYIFVLAVVVVSLVASCIASFAIGLLLGRSDRRVVDNSRDMFGRIRPGASFQAEGADKAAGIFHESGTSAFQAGDADTEAAFSALSELDSHINRAIRATSKDTSGKNLGDKPGGLRKDELRQRIVNEQAQTLIRDLARGKKEGDNG